MEILSIYKKNMGSDSAGNTKHFDSDLFSVLQVPGLPPS